VSQSPIREKVKRVMAATFHVPAEQIPDDATPENVKGWDSLGHIELMLALEMEFGVPLPTEKIIDLVNLDAIEGFLQGDAAAVAK
jgi:acyl carrier protein